MSGYVKFSMLSLLALVKEHPVFVVGIDPVDIFFQIVSVQIHHIGCFVRILFPQTIIALHWCAGDEREDLAQRVVDMPAKACAEGWGDDKIRRHDAFVF